ncbi:hypothetical protein BX667DRAFT_507344 [Coemansia mojavensis]|nr:hypothetical protein BX667DRAFT_507344 [Coemansia mojavensis]
MKFSLIGALIVLLCLGEGSLLEGLGHLLGLSSSNANEGRSSTIPVATNEVHSSIIPAVSSEVHIDPIPEIADKAHTDTIPAVTSKVHTSTIPSVTDASMQTITPEATSNQPIQEISAAEDGQPASANETSSFETPAIATKTSRAIAAGTDGQSMEPSLAWWEVGFEALSQQNKPGFDNQSSEIPVLRAPHPYAPPNGSSNAKTLGADMCIAGLICLLSIIFK